MKIKDLKKLIELYDDEKEVKVFGASGMPWEVSEPMLAKQILTDEKREVCKLYIK